MCCSVVVDKSVTNMFELISLAFVTGLLKICMKFNDNEKLFIEHNQ